eukprot:gene12218-15560_t
MNHPANPALAQEGRSAETDSSEVSRVVFASSVGTIIEWYDFLIYGTAAALVFNKIFFPADDPLMGTLAALGSAAVGFFARPFGGAVFGYFGDHQAYYEEDSPPYRYKLPEPKNVTQFQVRSNYPVPRETPVPIMDIAFLPGLLVDTSGVERDNYFES